MKQRFALIATVVLVAACAETPTGPQIALNAPSSLALATVTLANPSFESGSTGWSFPGSLGTFVDICACWSTTDGAVSVDLNGFYPGYVSQDIATTPGTAYTVLFDLAGNPGSPQNVKELEVSAAGTSALYYFDTTGKDGTNMGWTAQSFAFTATGTTTTLMFKSLHAIYSDEFPDRAQGAAIDNIRVQYTSNNPTTVDQCKKDGWIQYGFRNQGLCIQFVNTGKDSR